MKPTDSIQEKINRQYQAALKKAGFCDHQMKEIQKEVAKAYKAGDLGQVMFYQKILIKYVNRPELSNRDIS